MQTAHKLFSFQFIQGDNFCSWIIVVLSVSQVSKLVFYAQSTSMVISGRLLSQNAPLQYQLLCILTAAMAFCWFTWCWSSDVFNPSVCDFITVKPIWFNAFVCRCFQWLVCCAHLACSVYLIHLFSALLIKHDVQMNGKTDCWRN